MNQTTLNFEPLHKKTRKEIFLQEMEQVMPWAELVALISLIAVPSSTKNSSGKRDPEMHQTKKGNQWHFGMKTHIGVDADSGPMRAVIGTPANVNNVTQGNALLHGEEEVFADAGYQGADKREEATGVTWHIAIRPGKRQQQKHTPWVSCWSGQNRSRPACGPKWSIHYWLSNNSSAMLTLDTGA